VAKSKSPKPDAKAVVAAYRRALKNPMGVQPEDGFAGTLGRGDRPRNAAENGGLVKDSVPPRSYGVTKEAGLSGGKTGAFDGDAVKSLTRLRDFLPRRYGKVPAGDKAAPSPDAAPAPVLKTSVAEETRESKYRRVAKFLILIGTDEAAKVLENLDELQVETLSREIARIRGITPEEADNVLEEFYGLLGGASVRRGPMAGGVDAARRLLYTAFGPGKGEALLRKSIPGVRTAPFNFLEDFTGAQTALLLREETPAAIALVLSYMEPKFAAATLEELPSYRKAEIARRLAHMEKTSPDTVRRVAEALKEKAHRYAAAGGVVENKVDGMGTLTAILKHANISFGDRLLSELNKEDPELGKSIKERLYTLDDVVLAENKPIQDKLREMDDTSIALLIKRRSPEVIEKILSNVSVTRRAAVLEEQEFLGPVPRKDTDAVGKEFLSWFRRAREARQIFLCTDDDIVL
jgi:flagellar motor switch protein FliG